MIVYIHSHEIYDRGTAFGRHAGVSDIRHIVVPDGTDVAGIVSMVTAQVHDERSIWTLIFNGHGDDHRSGSMYFGSWIQMSDIVGFAPLAAYMNPIGRGVEIHCCRVGSNHSYVQRMADTFGVRVLAGEENQSGAGLRVPGTDTVVPILGDQVGIIEGPQVLCFPHGRSVVTTRR